MLLEKYQEFYNALHAIALALGLAKIKLGEIKAKIEEIITDVQMGLQEVTFKQNAIVYGIKIDESEINTEKRVSYTDDAQGMVPIKTDFSTGSCEYNTWKQSWLFNAFTPVMLKNNGVVDYELDLDNQKKKKGGGTSDIEDISYNGNAMVRVQKFYTKFSMDGEDEVIQVSDKPLEGFEPIGFVPDGPPTDNLFLPMFMGTCVKNSSGDVDYTLRSMANQSAVSSGMKDSFENYRSYAQKNGSGYDIESRATIQLVEIVFLLLAKNCNYSAVITNMGGGTNPNPNIVGRIADKGAIYCDRVTGCTKFMYMENYLNDYRWFNGLIKDDSTIARVKLSPPYDHKTSSGYTQLTRMPTSSTNPSAVNKMFCSNQTGRYPVEYGTANAYEFSNWSVYSVGSSGGTNYVANGTIKHVNILNLPNDSVSSSSNPRKAALIYLK